MLVVRALLSAFVMLTLACAGDDAACPAGQTECGGACVDLAVDRNHCGGCGTICLAGNVCSAGSCALTCQAGLSDCAGVCRDLETDRAHCGGCDTPCASGEACIAHLCVANCADGLRFCDGQCVDTDRDARHCGFCGNVCTAPATCELGDCTVPAELTTPVALQLLSLSDFHGQLDSVTQGTDTIGGAAVLATYFQQERAANPLTLVLAAGDSFGAAPPLSSLFGELPTIEALNLMGVDLSIFGNHAFDRGLDHLQTLIDLAHFPHIAANLDNLTDNLAGVVAPFQLVELGNVTLALIGIETPETPALVFPGQMDGPGGTITVTDPATAATAARSAAAAAGATVFVAVTHLGMTTCDPTTSTFTGPLADFAASVTGFHLIVGGHSHLACIATIDGTLVVENATQGRTYARVALEVVPLDGTLVSAAATAVTPVKPATGFTPDPAVTTMLSTYRSAQAMILDLPIGVATGEFPRGGSVAVERTGEVALGDLVADALRAKYATQLALVNGGGLRSALPSSYLPADTSLRRKSAGYAPGPPYDLVKGDVYAVLPFGNTVVTRTVTGAVLWQLLEHGIGALPAAAGKFPQISGFRFTYNLANAAGSKVTSVTLAAGGAIGPDATTYTIAVPDFLNVGGDGYTMLADGTGTMQPELMADVLLEHVVSQGTIAPTTDGRIAASP